MLRSACVRQHVIYLSARDIPIEQILAGTQLQATDINDPTFDVSLEDCYKVLENSRGLSDDPALGFHLGSGIGFSELGIIGYALTSATTLNQALTLWNDYVNSPLGFPLDSQLEIIDDHCWGISTATRGNSLSVNRLSLEEYIAMGRSFCSFLLDREPSLKFIEFAFPEPDYIDVYRQYFPCPMSFNAERNRIMVEGIALDTPLRSANEEVRTLCLNHYSQLKKQISRHGNISTRLKNALMLMGSIPDLDSAATRLNMSPRSLRRHLKEENTTFQKVLDEFRRDLACEYLKTGAISVKEMAYLLGFSREGNFRRAFKNWTGMTVGQYSE